MDVSTPDLIGKNLTGCFNNTSNALNVCATVHTAWKHLTEWKNSFNSYNKIMTKLYNISSIISSPQYAEKSVKLTSTAACDINECCTEVAKYYKDFFQFDLQSEITGAVGDGNSCINREKLKNLLSKLNSSMVTQLEKMLFGELVKAAGQTTIMLVSLVKTHKLIKNSRQYRESYTIRTASNRIDEYLKKANNFYLTAMNEISRIETTPEERATELTLGHINLHLDRARFECEYVQRELANILRDIDQKRQSLSSNKTDHSVNIGISLVNTFVTGLQYISTPSFMLSTVANALFAANGGLHLANTVGHSIGFYWSLEEIEKLEELQNEMKNLEATMNDIFEKIKYGMVKLDKIKQHIQTTPDHTLVVET